MKIAMKQGDMTLTVEVSDHLAAQLNIVNGARRGSFAYVSGLESGTVGKDKCERPSITDRWLLALPRYDKYTARMIAAIEPMTEAGVHTRMLGDKTAGRADFADLYKAAKESVLKSFGGTNEATAGHRAGQALCYATYGNTRVHLVTETGADGLKHPVLNADGNVQAESAMVSFFEIKRNTRQAAVYGTVNRQAKTIVQNAIKAWAHEITGLYDGWKHLSLSNSRYEFLTLDSTRIYGLVAEMNNGELDTVTAAAVREMGDLTDENPAIALGREAGYYSAQEPATPVDDWTTLDTSTDDPAPAPVR
jgi:hypothetical protein